MRANPEKEDSEAAAKLVTRWFMDHVHESVAEQMDPDALGQLSDTIAWKLTERRDELAAEVQRAVDGEREACAAVAMGTAGPHYACAEEIADAIRARQRAGG
jgi:hypothetical protein